MTNLIPTESTGIENDTTSLNHKDDDIISNGTLSPGIDPTQHPGNTSWRIETLIREKPWILLLCALVVFLLLAVVLICVSIRCLRRRKLTITPRPDGDLGGNEKKQTNIFNKHYASMNSSDSVFLSCEENGSIRRQPERVIYRRGTYGHISHAFRSTIRGHVNHASEIE